MRGLHYGELCSNDCVFKDISSYHEVFTENDIFDYELSGRSKHLLYYQLDGERKYNYCGRTICVIKKHDIIFIPDGTKYVSSSSNSFTSGIGISFNLYYADNTAVKIDEPMKITARDTDGQLYKHFRRIYFSVLHLPSATMRMKGELYTLLDKMFTDKEDLSDFEARYKDISPAIKVIERHPEQNITNSELAEMCFMSESSFLRKFKQYSSGISPMQYRNHIRIMRAEEFVNTVNSLSEIADILGFYDASHLCRAYKKYTGHNLKNQKKITYD